MHILLQLLMSLKNFNRCERDRKDEHGDDWKDYNINVLKW
jgi:hypothetical protein